MNPKPDSPGPLLATWLGYDPTVTATLSERHQLSLRRLCETWLVACILIAWGPAYALWLIEQSWLLSFGIGVACFVLTLNLLRVTHAGGGAAAHFSPEEVRAFQPSFGRSGLILALGLLFACPAQLPLWSASLDPVIAEHRAELIAEHEARAQERAAEGLVASTTEDRFRSELARNEFIVLRLKLMWANPSRVLAFSAVYGLFLLLPSFWARFVALPAVRAYEYRRWRAARRTILANDSEITTQLATLLGAFPSYQTPAPRFRDPPFNRHVIHPPLPTPKLPRATQ